MRFVPWAQSSDAFLFLLTYGNCFVCVIHDRRRLDPNECAVVKYIMSLFRLCSGDGVVPDGGVWTLKGRRATSSTCRRSEARAVVAAAAVVAVVAAGAAPASAPAPAAAFAATPAPAAAPAVALASGAAVAAVAAVASAAAGPRRAAVVARRRRTGPVVRDRPLPSAGAEGVEGQGQRRRRKTAV